MGLWTAGDDETLRREWPLGTPVRQIADMLPGKRTTNSIIGRAHRLGLSKHPTAQKKRLKPRAKPAAALNTPSATKVAQPLRDEPTQPMEDGCRWPVGMNPRVADFYCGAKRLDEKCSYCARHEEIAHASGSKSMTYTGFAMRKSVYGLR